ncbi:hypothetical protein JCM10450v2_000337 [Rhodotorula kratochvilovae]
MAHERFPIPATNRLAALPVETLNRVFAHLLVGVVARNDRLASKGAITRFHSKQPPPLEIGAYLERLTKYTPFPRDAILLAVVYLNRITHLPYTAEPDIHPVALLAVTPPRLPPRPPAPPPRSPPLSPGRLAPPMSPIEAPSPLPPSPTISSVDRPRVAPFLNSYTLHRLVLAVLLIATKFSADGTLSQTRAAKVGGVGASELCKLEGEGLRLLGWELGWSLDEIEGASREVERVAEEAGLIPREAAQRVGEAAPDPETAEEGEGEEAQRTPTFGPPSVAAALVSPPRLSVPTRPPLSSRSTSASLSTSSTAPSSEASTSQPSSSASSPQLLSPTHGRGRRVLPLRVSATAAERLHMSEAEEEETPPSSPSASSADGCDDDRAREVEEKEYDPDARMLSPRTSCETVRRFEGLQLTAP